MHRVQDYSSFGGCCSSYATVSAGCFCWVFLLTTTCICYVYTACICYVYTASGSCVAVTKATGDKSPRRKKPQATKTPDDKSPRRQKPKVFNTLLLGKNKLKQRSYIRTNIWLEELNKRENLIYKS